MSINDPPRVVVSHGVTRDPGDRRPSLRFAVDLEHLPIEELLNHRDVARDAVDEELYRRMIPLARKLAARYRSQHESPDDLFQVASVGLLGAIRRFDPSRGTRFVSFAIPTMLGELKRHFRDTGWSVHVTRRGQELAARVENASVKLTDTLGRAPDARELAEYLEVDIETVLEGWEIAGAHFSASLDAPAPGDERPDGTVGSTIGHEDEGFALVDTVSHLQDGLRRLPYQERHALELHAGGNLRQRDIAERLGCSQMQVSRLLARAAQRIAG